MILELCLNEGGLDYSYLAGAKVDKSVQDGGEGRGRRLHWHTLWVNIQDRSMGAKGKPFLNLTPSLDRGQSRLETVHAAPEWTTPVWGCVGALALCAQKAGADP